jgi:hypothetical protein
MATQFAPRLYLMLALVGLYGCSDDEDPISETEATNVCNAFCSRAEECFGDDEVDLDRCNDDCFDAVQDEIVEPDELDDCTRCLNNTTGTCTEACDDTCADAFETFDID